MDIAIVKAQKPKLFQIFDTCRFLLIIVPVIIGLIYNRWFIGQYTIQMQVPRDIRLQFPEGMVPIGIYTKYPDLHYYSHHIHNVITWGSLYIALVLAFTGLKLQCYHKVLKRCRPCQMLFRYHEWVLIAAAAIGVYVRKVCLYDIFVGIHDVDEEIIVAANTPGIMLSVFEAQSFSLFRISTDFALFFAAELLCTRCIYWIYCMNDHDEINRRFIAYKGVNGNGVSAPYTRQENEEKEQSPFDGYGSQ